MSARPPLQPRGGSAPDHPGGERAREPASVERSDPSDVRRIELDGRELVMVGTAHVSRESADLVREVIERERPDAVCLELDAQRYEGLAERSRWESLNLVELIRSKRLAALLANLLLATWQRRLGGALGVVPGAEMLEAARVAERLGIPVALCDRDVRVTCAARGPRCRGSARASSWGPSPRRSSSGRSSTRRSCGGCATET